MISLIITTKNRPDFLYRCLLAVERQTWGCEVIVVGDHCNYAKRIVKKFSQALVIKFIDNRTVNEINVGATGKNIGIETARGDKICYCDDDNILLPNHIETMLKFQAEFLVSKFIHSDHGQSSAYEMLNTGLYDVRKPTIGGNDALTLCHTKELWRAAGGWKPMQDVGYNEDGYFMNELSKHAERIEIPVVTAIYHQHTRTGLDDYYQLLPKCKTVVYPELINKWN